jgi:antitoxin YobK
MSHSNLQQAFDIIAAAEVAHFAGTQPPQRIARAEEALGTQFPPTYHEFVSRLGCGSFDGEEFYGIANDDFETACVPNAIWVTRKRREQGHIPPAFIVFSTTGDGADYVIDTSQKNAVGDSPVLECWSGAPISELNRQIVAPDFGEFFLRTIRNALDGIGAKKATSEFAGPCRRARWAGHLSLRIIAQVRR